MSLFQKLAVSGVVVLLAGCSSGNTVQNPVNPIGPGPMPAPGASKVFVSRSTAFYSNSGNTYDGDIFELGTSANGVVQPSVSLPITTETTHGIALDAAGNLYVGGQQWAVNNGLDGPSAGFVNVYAPGFTATSAPTRTIQLPGVNGPEYLAVDGSGQLYVLSTFTETIYVYSSGSSTPTRTITGSNTGVTDQCYSLTVDAAGQLYVVSAAPAEVLVFASGANGDVAPTRTVPITGGIPYGAVIDGSGNLYVNVNDTTGSTPTQLKSVGSIQKFAPGASTPSSTIQGSATTLFDGGGLTIDNAGNLWLTNLMQDSAGNNSQTVLEFAAGASGNVAPLKSFTLSGWEPAAGPWIAVE